MPRQNFRVLFPVAFIFISLASGYSYGAQPIDLAGAVAEALANSPSVKAASAQAETNHWRKTEAFAGYLPTVAINSTYLTNKKYLVSDLALPGASNAITIPQTVPTTTWTATAQMMIFDGFATSERNAAADSLESGAESNVEWQKFQIEHDVVLQFYRAVAASQLLAVANQNQTTMEDHLKDVRLFKNAGMSTNYDVLRVEVQASEARTEVMSAEDNAQMARVKLGELMGAETGDSGSFDRLPTGELPTLTSGQSKQVADVKIMSRKDLQAMQLKVDSADRSASAARRHYMPKVSLFGQYQYYNNKNDSPTDRSAFRNAYSTGLALNWVLFDGFASTARARSGASEKAEMEFALSAKRRKAQTDVEFWRRKLAYFANLTTARKGDISKSDESVRLAKVGQKEGSRTSSDLLDAELELFRAKADSINAQMGAIEAMVNLELATGRSLYKFW